MSQFQTRCNHFVTSARFRQRRTSGATGPVRAGRVRLESVEGYFQRIEFVWIRADAISPWLCRPEFRSRSIVRLVGLAIGREFSRPRGAVQSACCARLAPRVLKRHSARSLDPSTVNVRSIIEDVSPRRFQTVLRYFNPATSFGLTGRNLQRFGLSSSFRAFNQPSGSPAIDFNFRGLDIDGLRLKP